MDESDLPPPCQPDHPVWTLLTRYRIGPLDAALSFERRLARENGWTLGHAEQVAEEYRRFCFLAATGDRPVTPSDAVDQAWHLHLTYTHDYWERFCPDVLGRPLHHGPTAGGAAEQHRFFEQYAWTLHAYQQAFGVTPPADIWPDARRRLIDDPRARRVHPRDAFVVSRRVLWSSALAVGVVGAVLWMVS